MTIIDAQVHAYERDRPERPWIGHLHGPDEVTGDHLVAAMDDVGVDGALLVSPWSMYRYDASYCLEVLAAHPGRFGVIKPFDAKQADVGEQIDEWAANPGVVGARLMLAEQPELTPETPGLVAALDAGARNGLPINLLCMDRLDLVAAMARSNRNCQLVIDHLGLRQPFEPPIPAAPWADLDAVLALAEHDNVAIKITGACTLSHQPFPFPDLWEPLARIFDTFGFERCLWGTDWTRAVEFLDYRSGVEVFRLTDSLSESERAMLMGGAVTKIYDWSPAAG